MGLELCLHYQKGNFIINEEGCFQLQSFLSEINVMKLIKDKRTTDDSFRILSSDWIHVNIPAVKFLNIWNVGLTSDSNTLQCPGKFPQAKGPRKKGAWDVHSPAQEPHVRRGPGLEASALIWLWFVWVAASGSPSQLCDSGPALTEEFRLGQSFS